MASTPKRRVNASAARRAREELLAKRAAPPPPLPPQFVQWLTEQYKPAVMLRARWAVLVGFIIATLQRAGITGEESLRKHVTHLAYFGCWALEQGLELTPATVVRVHVDEYCRTGMAGSSLKSQSDRRSRLRRVADNVNPEQAPRPALTVPRESIKPPYPGEQMAAFRRVAQVQPTDELIRQMCVCVGLGGGAGIDSPELKLLFPENVEDCGSAGIVVHVPGARARDVWVLRECEELVRRGLQDARAGKPLIGRVTHRHNVAAAVYGRATLAGSLPKLEQSRLRTTWLATLMSRPVPLAVLLHAAGLRSTRTLFDLLPHLTADDEQQVAR